MRQFGLFCVTTTAAALLAASTQAAVLGIDSVTLNGDDSLNTATVGGTAYDGGTIATSAEDNRGTSFGHPTTPGDAAPTGTTVDGTGDQALAYDNNVLTGNAGSNGNANQNGGVLVLRWGDGSLVTDNDANPDFFVFEDLGNDTVEVQAILSDGTVGTAVTLSGWNTVSSAGVLGTNGSGGNLSGRTVSGVAFDFTDLLDASGAALTNGTAIQGIVIGDAGAADIYEVYANVDVVPEPTSLALLGLGGLCMMSRRRR